MNYGTKIALTELIASVSQENVSYNIGRSWALRNNLISGNGSVVSYSDIYLNAIIYAPIDSVL